MQHTGDSDYVSLHCHSNYSFLDGIITPQQYAEECANRKIPAHALTEHGHMGSIAELYWQAKKYNVKSIAGCEIYYNDYEPERQRLAAEGIKMTTKEWKLTHPVEYYRIVRNRHLTVLCKNQTGFHNLIKLTTEAYRDGSFGMGTTKYNRIWFDKLAKYKEGLIVLSGCLNGPVAHELRFTSHTNKEGEVVWERSKVQAFEAAAAYVKKFKDLFGEDYWIELQMPGIPGDDVVFADLCQLAEDFKIKTALANDCHYKTREDHIIQMVMMAISQGVTVDSPDLFHVNSSEQYFKTRSELREYFQNNNYSNLVPLSTFESSCDNTLEIANRCDYINVPTDIKLPQFTDNDQKLAEICIRSLIRKGLHQVTKRYDVDGNNVTYLEQLKIELTRMQHKGFSSYFLVLEDIISYGRSKNAMFGPRGSGAGCLVCFLLGLSSMDPLKWGLSFDRFLSPSRGGYMLDINMPEPVKG